MSEKEEIKPTKIKVCLRPKPKTKKSTVKKEMYSSPIIKWVGGKTQIIDKLIEHFPKVMDNYHEIFLGGGSVLFALLDCIKKGTIKVNGDVCAYDINQQLINMYTNVQNHHVELFKTIKVIIDEYNSCDGEEINRDPKTIEEAKTSQESYYYWIRKQYNNSNTKVENTLLESSYFIFLNKTGFRGMFRIGPNGFNVPFGHYKNPSIMIFSDLEKIHDLIKDVKFMCIDFTQSISRVKDGDFVYLDPPYAPENSKSFVKYTDNGFTLENHEQLFGILKELKCKLLLSNADVELVTDNFSEKPFNTEKILCKRSINSKNPESKAKEVLISN
jgi:DNA adenine methylase